MAQPALPIANLDRFIKLLMMTTSPVDSEALVALRKATAIIDAAGITWESLIRGRITVIADPFSSIPQPPKTDINSNWKPPTPPTPTARRTQPQPPPPPPPPRKPTRANPASIDQL